MKYFNKDLNSIECPYGIHFLDQYITSNKTAIVMPTGEYCTSVLNKTDIPTVKQNFIQNIINTIIKSIVSIILSPKVLTLFVINFKLIYGQNADFSDPIDYLKKNKQLMNTIMKSIAQEIIKILIKIAILDIFI